MRDKFYVTTPIYYVNDRPHIGSAYTTVAADVLARYYRQKEYDVYSLTGTAEHGSKVAGSAEAEGLEPQNFVDRNAEYFKQAWEALNIEYDGFIRTTEERHAKAVNDFFNKLHSTGKLYESEYEGLYCVGHEAFIKESELDEHGNCPDHGKPPETVKEKNWFFKLSEYGDFLKDKIESGEMEIAPKVRSNEVLSFIEQGLEDIAISRRTAKFALPLPWDEEQTIYVWLDELFNYCSAIGYGEYRQQFTRFWPADVHIVGKDIIKFHCVIWPALLDAIGERLPRKVFAHGFFTVDGRKMSKSLGNMVDPVELVNEYGADAVRYYLLRDIPFGNDGDFSHERFKERYNSDLANGLGNLVSRTLNMFERYWPDFEKSEMIPKALEKKLSYVDKQIKELSFDQALVSIWEMISWTDSLIEQKKPWELAKEGRDEEMKHVLAQLYESLQVINKKIKPFMPDAHDKIDVLLEARPLKKPGEPLFARK